MAKKKINKKAAKEAIVEGELEALVRSTTELKQKLETDVDILQDEIGDLKRAVSSIQKHMGVGPGAEEKMYAMEDGILSKLLEVAKPLRKNMERIDRDVKDLKKTEQQLAGIDVLIEQKVENKLAEIKSNNNSLRDIQNRMNTLVKNKLQELEASAVKQQSRETESVEELKKSINVLKMENSQLRAEVLEVRKSKLEELKNIYKNLPVVLQ